MKIAGIIITFNDDYKFNEWCRWYEEYKDELYQLIIVDNGSNQDYIRQVEEYFKNAIIIKRTTNGGCTIAYNDGIRVALEDPKVTHIALIGNDIRLKAGALTKCVALLDSDNELGMVAPVLLNADSDIVADYGCSINQDLSMNPYGVGMRVQELNPAIRYCESVTGGMNVSKRSFYAASVGLQDENLFMYSDEVDMGLRAKRAGVKMAVLKDAVAWHQHINPPGSKFRHPFSSYLIARNKVYLGKKHFGWRKQWAVFIHFLVYDMLSCVKILFTFKWRQLVYPRWSMIGAINGLRGDMRENRFSKI